MPPLSKTLKGLNEAINRRHEAAIVELETLYRKIRKQPRLTVRDMMQATRLHNRIALFTPELYLYVIAVLFLLMSSGSFATHAVWTAYSRHVFIGTLLILSFLVPMLLNYGFMPLHIIGGLSLLWTAGFLVMVSTPVITFLARHMTTYITGTQVSLTLDIILPVSGTLLFGTALLLMRNYNRTCYSCFNRRYPDDSLESTLPPDKHGQLQAMEAQDHYVLFITSNGEDLQRMTLTEAIARVPEDSGLRVHRSHWVAKSQMLDLVQVQQKYILVLRNGRQVPVGKANVEAVRALL